MTKRPNIREIARRAGCATSTVSRVLSKQGAAGPEMTKKIMDICTELDYTPSIHAVRFFSRRSKAIGMLLRYDMPWEDANLVRSLSGVCGKLTELGYRCIPLQSTEKFFREKEYLNIFRRIEIDGLIIWGEYEDAEYLRELTAEKMPFILLCNRVADYPAVVSNQYDAMCSLIRHCQAKGAKKTVFFDWPGVGDSCDQRRKAFRDQAGENAPVILGKRLMEENYPLTAQLLELAPDAIICANDGQAVEVERYLLEHSIRVPDEIMLTGADNGNLSQYCAIPISTFDQRSTACAELCAQKMVRFLEDGTPLQSEMLPAEVIFRASTQR